MPEILRIADDTMHAVTCMSKEDTCEWAYAKHNRSDSPDSLEHMSRATTPRADDVAHIQAWSDDVAQVQAVAEPEWVPLSVRQSQARERFEAQERAIAKAAAATKLAQMVAPFVVDEVSGLPCIPDSCCAIKHYNRWLVANVARVDAVARRRSTSRIQANKVMQALVANSLPLVYANYCAELAVLESDLPSVTTPAAPKAFAATRSTMPWDAAGKKLLFFVA